jgi:hypothetical protein
LESLLSAEGLMGFEDLNHLEVSSPNGSTAVDPQSQQGLSIDFTLESLLQQHYQQH